MLKWTIKIAFLLIFLSLVFILLCNYWVVESTRANNYFSLAELPSNDVGLVLGTSPKTMNGKNNLFFDYRIDAAARLYKEGKIKYIILSGNNDSEFYNEPSQMRKALIARGVPEDVLTLDFAGFRTFDSIVRGKEVFNQERFTIISQNFHNARALFIAQREGINAIAFSAQDVPTLYSPKTFIREYLARPKAVLDLYIARPQMNLRTNNEIRKASDDDNQE